MVDAFKLFLTDEILDIIVLHANNYARKYYNQRSQSRLNKGVYKPKFTHWKEIDRIELEAFIGPLIQASAANMGHRSIDEL
ncbi:unnamed protein product [Adineta ricciae]|uniref:PiggyBac transposable element-derived protein domain-containing protein n=1 Tax=Adineta ricciae TaxID=249248 RepID=A0A815T393_ADIRI|nr:unnamed protein product [Adineta ricciae]CAF1495881.1 unnamed protein product [Adineta ricciae]